MESGNSSLRLLWSLPFARHAVDVRMGDANGRPRTLDSLALKL